MPRSNSESHMPGSWYTQVLPQWSTLLYIVKRAKRIYGSCSQGNYLNMGSDGQISPHTSYSMYNGMHPKTKSAGNRNRNSLSRYSSHWQTVSAPISNSD